jgi:hypothetical protein
MVTLAEYLVALRIACMGAVLCLPIEVIPDGVDLLRLRHDDNARCVGVWTRTCDGSEGFNVTCGGGLLAGGGWGRRRVACYRCIGAGRCTLVSQRPFLLRYHAPPLSIKDVHRDTTLIDIAIHPDHGLFHHLMMPLPCNIGPRKQIGDTFTRPMVVHD